MPDVFKLYTKMFGKGDKFIKGTFTVDTTMSYSALISELQTVSTVNQTVSIQITEGMTIDEIAQMMEVTVSAVPKISWSSARRSVILTNSRNVSRIKS